MRVCRIHGAMRCRYRHWRWQVWRQPFSPSTALCKLMAQSITAMADEMRKAHGDGA